jgi:heat shock protein beta
MKMIKVMSKKLVRKALEMIRALAEDEEEEEDDEYDGEEGGEDADKKKDDSDDKEEKEDAVDEKEEERENQYNKFWKSFGKNIKLGIIEDASNRNKLAKLLRFHSTNDPEGLTSLDEYISRMKPEQDTILYLPGDSREAI